MFNGVKSAGEKSDVANWSYVRARPESLTTDRYALLESVRAFVRLCAALQTQPLAQ